jgi:hypothetical protein
MRTGLTAAPLDFRRFGREVWDLPIFAFLAFAFAGIALATFWIFDFDLDLAALTFVATFVHSPSPPAIRLVMKPNSLWRRVIAVVAADCCSAQDVHQLQLKGVFQLMRRSQSFQLFWNANLLHSEPTSGIKQLKLQDIDERLIPLPAGFLESKSCLRKFPA